MGESDKRKLVPYETVSPGFEAIYTGEKSDRPIESNNWPISRFTDKNSNVIEKWSVWTWRSDPAKWDEEIRCLNALQERLGHLDDDTRQVRAQIGSLVLCESGIPTTVDDILMAIGRARFLEPPLHNGCWCGGMWWENRVTQHGQEKAMAAIEQIILGYLAAAESKSLIERFPDAEGFIRRTYGWLPLSAELSEIQRLMIRRMLLPFEFFTKRNADCGAVNHNCFEDGGRGSQLDGEISRLAGLPKIYPDYKPEFYENLQTVGDPRKKDLYRVCGAIAHGLHGLSHCHHSMFRWIERWVHDIGTLSPGIPERIAGTERRRLAELLFGYTLGLDKWLLGRSMPFLLMDLSYADIGFNPKNEILRVYAYLGHERTAVKEWLVACLWKSLSGVGNPRGWVIQKDIADRAGKLGINTRGWIDSEFKKI
ncbi:MAG: hypothetical protein ABII89_06005 [Candidatus Omnitrophota bacterium]